jgi:ubiquinone/menaquinone biosynthesis C-methylase UbiE
VKLNIIEKALMNNPAREQFQSLYEAPLLERLGGRVDGDRVLEVGCGRGVGTELIIERLGAAHVTAFDSDPAMVAMAERRLRRYLTDQVDLSVGDVTAIDAPDASFDAVFDFGIIHHVPTWRDAVAEIARVLRPGGRFFFEEVTKKALDHWSFRLLFEHPSDDRFTGASFVAECTRHGMTVEHGRWVERFGGFFFMGAAVRDDGGALADERGVEERDPAVDAESVT